MPRCTCVTSLDELKDFEGPWESLRKESGGSIFTSYRMSRAWLSSYEGIVEPRVMIAEESGEVVGIVPMAIKQHRVSGVPVRMVTLVGDGDLMLCLNTLSPLIRPGREDILEALIRSIRSLDWNLLRANFMEDTQGSKALLKRLGSDRESLEQRSSRSIVISLPSTGDIAEVFEKETRRDLYRVLRKNERETKVSFRTISSDRLDEAVDMHAQQHIQRWGAKGGSIFEHPDNIIFLKKAVSEALDGGYGFGRELLIDDQIAAQLFVFLENGTVFAYRTGMNNSFHNRSPGLVLMHQVMNEVRDEGNKVFNLGEGDERYKDYLGGKGATLLGGEIKRGLVSLLSTIRGSAPVRMLGSVLDLKDGEGQDR